MTKSPNLMTAIALGAALIASTPVLAEDAHHPAGVPSPAAPQSNAPMPMPQPPAATPAQDQQQGGMGGTGPMGMMTQMMAPARIEGRIAFLRAELGITAAQQPLWDAFAEALRTNARGMTGMMSAMQEQMMSGQGATAATLPKRIEAHESMLAARLEALRKVKTALDPLYASFGDAQKRTADQLLMPMPMGLM
ncbi:Spy/CpxP family protein refolding chaperone [Aquabacter sp. CN5-332]|uniref:Spy/CpxP family protein refolding chaperone n=1 Tax=Aquabacter sp. CN5-332 TaxID=3156608 RepID=UPI0032B34B19